MQCIPVSLAWMQLCAPHGIHLSTALLPASDVSRFILCSNSIMELTRGVRSQLQGLIRCVTASMLSGVLLDRRFLMARP